MLSAKKFRELLGKEYEKLSDEEVDKLMHQLVQLADIYIDLAMGSASKISDPPSPSPSPREKGDKS